MRFCTIAARRLSGVGGVAAARDRAPHRQGHIGPAGRGQVRSRASGAGRAIRETTPSSGITSPLRMASPDASDPRLRGNPWCEFREPGNIMKITSDLARHKHDRQRQAVLFGGGRHAVTPRPGFLESFGTPPTLSLVECWLETGRTHQIRVHMAHAGHGLVGRSGLWRAAQAAAARLAPCRADGGARFPAPGTSCRHAWIRAPGERREHAVRIPAARGHGRSQSPPCAEPRTRRTRWTKSDPAGACWQYPCQGYATSAVRTLTHGM